ncbi:hypothetical protein [Shouchella patagoniensis]|uniref:hypothetical protein n=1 Tax=Shouchella patagoniensis TaxID=228576 RepID=UPI001115D552|nr:hypothetical protein [Shouchella patagoniensis]
MFPWFLFSNHMLGFPLIPVGIIAIVGNLISVLGFIWIIDKVRGGNKERKEGGRWRRAQNFFRKYGVPGVSLAGPLIGYHIGAAIALAAGASRQYVTLWQIIAITLWAIALTIAFALGANFNVFRTF